MRKAICILALVIASALSGGCYVTQDANGQWWACEDHPSNGGNVNACTPIQAPF